MVSQDHSGKEAVATTFGTEIPTTEQESRLVTLRFPLAMLLCMAMLLVLKTPGEWTSVFLLAIVLLFVVVALRDFTTAWILGVMLLPYFALFDLFGQTKIDGPRVLLLGMILIFLAKPKPNVFWKSLFGHVGILGYLAFVTANILSAAWAGELEYLWRSLAYFVPLLVCILTYYVVRLDSANAQRILRVIILGGIPVVILGLVEVATQQSVFSLLGLNVTLSEDLGVYFSIDRFGLGGRIVSTLGQPVYAGLYFGIWLILAAFYIPTYAPKYKMLVLGVIPLGTLLMLATGSRGPLLALIPTVLIFGLFSPAKNRSWLFVAALAGLIGYVVLIRLPSVADYFRATFETGRITEENANLLGRITLTSTMLESARSNPIFGVGPGFFQKRMAAGLAGLENQYAVILAEGGFLAGIAYLIFTLGALATLMRLVRRPDDIQALALVCLLLFTFYFVFAIAATSLVSVSTLLLMAVYGATLASHDNKGLGCAPTTGHENEQR